MVDVTADRDVREQRERASPPEFLGDVEIGIDAAEDLAITSKERHFLRDERCIGAELLDDPTAGRVAGDDRDLDAVQL